VAQALTTFEPMARDRGVGLVGHVEPGLAARGDNDLLGLAVINLLDNAIKYTPSGRHVALELTRSESGSRLVITDQGPGVAPEDRPHIFDRFYRGRPSHSGHPSGGGGIGLAVVRWVVEGHGGTVRLLDRDLGAAFELELPGPLASSEENP
jgi:two-component system, OmpR family, sensor kinase